MSDNPGNALRSMVGSAPSYTGYSSNGSFSDLGEGLPVSGAQFRVRDFDIGHMNGACVNFSGSSAWQDMGLVEACKLHDSWKGIWTQSGAEGFVAANNFISNCVFGAHINSGNNSILGAQIVYCSIGVKVGDATIGANDSHGVVSGVCIRHCTYLVTCQNVSLGEVFSGCQLTAGQSGSDQGIVQIIGSRGIAFTGCELCNVDITVDATSQLSLDHTVFRGTVNVTVTSGGVFKSYNPVVISGSTLTLNGAAWNGAN